jgi:phosphohistidine phosphatase SixA
MKALRLMLACALLTIAGTAAAAEPQIIFLVRHAERATSAPAAPTAMTAAPDDPPLSAAGHDRAARLAVMLSAANIRYIYATEFLRTQQTAAPTAQARHLQTVSLPANNSDAIVTQVRQLKGNVLIVGHSNTVPGLLKGLGIKDDITIADSEYDNLFIVVRPEAGEPTLIRLKY